MANENYLADWAVLPEPPKEEKPTESKTQQSFHHFWSIGPKVNETEVKNQEHFYVPGVPFS